MNQSPPSPAQQKWDKIYSQNGKQPSSVCGVLLENSHLLPTAGKAIEIACGLGSNAFFLANKGLATVAWDLSPVAINRIKQEAERLALPITAETKDVTSLPPQASQYDVIVISNFLDRSSCQTITTMLKPGGLLYYQTFICEKASPEGPSNPEYLLEPNELLQLFPALRVIVYREEGLIGDLSRGFRNQAKLVAIKPIPLA